MKNKTLFFLLLFVIKLQTSLAQKQSLFLDKDFYASIAQSKLEKKPVVVMFYATWCSHCNKMKNDIFTDNDVINYYSKNFICVAVDAESQNGIDLKNRFKSKFKVKFYPTFTFLDSDENVLNCISGESKKDDFLNEAKNALIPEKQFTTLKSIYYQDFSNPENCLRYITAIRKSGLDATEVTEKYLQTKAEKDWFTEQNWKIIANGINNIDCYEIKFVNSHKDEFAKVSSPLRVEKKLVFVTSDNLKPLIDLNDTINYYKLKPIATSFKIRKVDSLLFKYDLQLYENNKNWKCYTSTAKNSIEKFAWKDSKTLIEVASFYLNFITDKSSLDDAINWTIQALTLGESLDKCTLLSKLYLSNKDLLNALTYAMKGKEIAVKYGSKSEEIDKLILEIKKLQ
jgi:thioredoxin-related protein